MIPIAPAPDNARRREIEVVKKKQSRAKRSCDMCRRKKTRCDADIHQPCSKCRTANVDCVFLIGSKKRGPLSGNYVHVLENRLQRMEALIVKMANSKKDVNQTKTIEGIELSESSDPEGVDTQSQHSRTRSAVSGSDVSETARSESVDQEACDFIERQLSQLNLSDYQRTRFIGASSGVHYVAQEIFPANDKHPVEDEPSWFVHKLNDEEDEHVLIKVQDTRQKPVDNSKSRSVNRIEMFEDMPLITERLVDYLLYLYFTRVQIYYPIINKVQFLEEYYLNNPTPPDKYLLYAMAFVGICIFNLDDSSIKAFTYTSEQLEEIQIYLKEKAESVLGVVYKRSMISTVQTLIILSMFTGYVENDTEDTRHWLISGMAIRMAQDIGLHRDCSTWHIPSYEIEVRKRIWHTCYHMDKCVASELGRPITIVDEEFDVPLPCPYELDYLPKTSVSSDESDVIPILIMEAEFAITHKQPVYSAFLYIVKLSQISGQILVGLHSPVAKKNQSKSLELFKNLDRQLADWKASLPPELTLHLSKQNNASNRQATVITVGYSCVLLLLYRPFIQILEGTEMGLKVIQACTTVANNMAVIIESMNQNSVLALPWNTSIYALFQSAIIFLHNIKGNDKLLAEESRKTLIRCVNSCKIVPFSKGLRQLKLLYMLIKHLDVSMEEIEYDQGTHNKVAPLDGISNQQVADQLLNQKLYFTTSPFLETSNTLREFGNCSSLHDQNIGPCPFSLASASNNNENCASTESMADSIPCPGPASQNAYVEPNMFLSMTPDLYPNLSLTQANTIGLPEYMPSSNIQSTLPLGAIPNSINWSEWDEFLKRNVFDEFAQQ